jgi:hypothetical protein
MLTQSGYHIWFTRVWALSFLNPESSGSAPYPISYRICPGLSHQPDRSD